MNVVIEERPTADEEWQHLQIHGPTFARRNVTSAFLPRQHISRSSRMTNDIRNLHIGGDHVIRRDRLE